MRHFLDTNYLIRFITNDVPTQAKKAKQFIKSNKHIYIPSIVLAETTYILENHYQASKKDVCNTLLSLLKQPQIETPDYIALALEIYLQENISFYDSLLIAEAIKNRSKLHSFDQKLVMVYQRLKN